MAEQAPILVSRAEIARHAGVQRAAVTNWLTRYTDFPGPAAAGNSQVFDAADVATWLDGRTIPTNNLIDGETAGQDYGGRFRRNTGLPPTNSPLQEPMRMESAIDTTWRLMDELRNRVSPEDYLTVFAPLIYLQGRHPQIWAELKARFLHEERIYLLDDAWHQARQAERDEHQGGVWLAERPFSDTPIEPSVIRMAIQFIGEVHRSMQNDPRSASSRSASAKLFLWMLEMYSKAQGRRSSEFFTPRAIVTLAVDLLDPSSATPRIYDPFCRAGEFLDEAVSRLGGGGSGLPEGFEIHGQHYQQDLCSLAQMNLRLHGADPKIYAGYWWDRETPGQKHDLVFANPPFNMRPPDKATFGRTWRYGEPPPHNGNFAWLQYVLSSLRPGGHAAVVMPNNAGLASNPREYAIRAAMVDDGVIECVIALPAQLFHGTGIPVSLWLLREPSEPSDAVLFIDAARLGTIGSRRTRMLTGADTSQILAAHAQRMRGEQVNLPDFARTVAITEIRTHDYALNPSGYIQPFDPGLDTPAQQARVASLVRRSSNLKRRIRDLAPEIDQLASLPGNESEQRDGWPIVDLGELCGMKAGPSGTDVRAPAQHSDGVPILLPRHLRRGHIVSDDIVAVGPDVARHLIDYRLEVDDVICTRVGDLGRVARLRLDQQGWLLSTGLVRLRAGNRILPSFLAHALASKASRDWIMRNTTGTVTPSITLRTLARLPVVVPPIERQRWIADALDAIAEQAYIHARLAETTDQIRETICAAIATVPGPGRDNP